MNGEEEYEVQLPSPKRRRIDEDLGIHTSVASSSGIMNQGSTASSSQTAVKRRQDEDTGALDPEERVVQNVLDIKGKGKARQTSVEAIDVDNIPPSYISIDDDEDPAPIPGQSPKVGNSDAPDALSDYNCPICFCPPTAAVITLCGHVMCGACLFTAVESSSNRARLSGYGGEALKHRCPVCRRELVGWDGRGGGVIGLNVAVATRVIA